MIITHTVSATMPRLLCFLCFFLCLQLLSSAARGGGHHDGDLKAKPLIVVKIWCLILVFIGTFISGMSPYFLKWNEGFLVLGTQFAGGVFLGNGLMHFLSDANETFEDLTSKTYPFAFMLACAGYLVTMLADSVISYVYGKGRSGGNDGNVKLEVEGGNIEQEKRSPNNGSSQSHVQMHSGGGHEHTITSARSFGDSILLILALCFHSFFEGIAIGVAQSESDAWKSLWIISLHKMFAAIAMGISLLQLIPDRPFASCVTYAFAFAISSPIGVAVGIVIDATSQGLVADWTFAISMGIACGVFVYVSINHLLAKGYIPQSKVYVDTPHYRFLAVLLGVGVIALAMIWDT